MDNLVEEQPPEQATSEDIPVVQEQEEEVELVPDNIETALLYILQQCEKEDEDIRLREMRTWRILELYMDGIFNAYWDESVKDYRTLNNDDFNDEDGTFRRTTNITRAHAESIIAALSVKVPGVTFFPDDAEDVDDINTSKALGEIVKQIQKHNKAPLALIRCLTILWNQGTIFAHNYYRTDPKFGSIESPITENVQEPSFKVYCDNCGALAGETRQSPPSVPMTCVNCGVAKAPMVIEHSNTVEQITGYRSDPKGRVGLDYYGPKNVKVSFWARSQEQIGYLLLKLDTHQAMAKSVYKELKDKIGDSNDSGWDTYERYLRLAPEYYGQVPQHLLTIKALWLRPWMYWICSQDEDREYLEEKFPNGAAITFINGKIAAIDNECLDDKWTISYDPLSEFIHGEPIGKPIIPVQDMDNDLLDLSMQTIEYAISENYVNPKVVDLQKYASEPAAPGMLTPATPVAGQTLADGFFQTKPAVLGREVDVFSDKLEKRGQFLVGDFPSLFGGTGDTETAYEYQKSNAQALQRLSLIWKKYITFNAEVMAKSAIMYAENLKEDEKTVRKENGRFINTWIRKEMLDGKIGHVEPESSDQLPQSWEQKWMLITKMLEMKDPAINSVLLAPENSEFLKQVVGLSEFFIPGETDRNKQFSEIFDLIAGDANVGVDLMVDDHPVHMRVIRNFLTSSQGIYLYKTNPKAYQAIIQHYLEHEKAQMEATMSHAGESQPGEKPPTNNG